MASPVSSSINFWKNHASFADRWVLTVREECLNQLLILHDSHLRRVMGEYIGYYNEARPHQGIVQQTPIPYPRSKNVGKIQSRKVLGGILWITSIACLPTNQYISVEIITSDLSITQYFVTPAMYAGKLVYCCCILWSSFSQIWNNQPCINLGYSTYSEFQISFTQLKGAVLPGDFYLIGFLHHTA